MLTTNFSSGELSKTLFGRTDLRQYYSGAAHLENFDVIPTGGIKRRSGMERLLPLAEDGRLIPFIVNRDLSFLLYFFPERTYTEDGGEITRKAGVKIFKVEGGELSPLKITRIKYQALDGLDNDSLEDIFEEGAEGIREKLKDRVEELTIHEIFDGEETRITYEDITYGSPETGTHPVWQTITVDEVIHAAVPLYKTAEEIQEIQYAQNYDTMILCHENYPPLEVKLEDGNQLTIRRAKIDNEVRISSTNTTDDELRQQYPEGKKDEKYTEDKYLQSEGNYPRCVTFFNGRVVFAGTKNAPQMVFASRVLTDEDKLKGVYPFATYDFFATKHRKYTAVLGAVNPDDLSEIFLDDIYERFKFTESELWNYKVESPFYDEGTRIERMSGDRLKLTGPGQAINPLTSDEIAELDGKVTSFNYNNYNKTNHGMAGYIDITPPPAQGGPSIRIQANLRTGTDEFSFGSGDDDIEYWPTDVARKMEEPDYLYNRLYNEVLSRLVKPPQYIMWTSSPIHVNSELLRSVADLIYQRLTQTMKYDFRSEEDYGKTMYDKPEKIRTELKQKFSSTAMYITFYTEEYIEDSHPTPDCGFTFEIASDMSDAIRWLAVNKGLIVGTEMAEWVMPPDIHAMGYYAVRNSGHGSDRIPGAAVGDATCFFTSGRKGLVEYYIPEADNHFRANNMAMLAPQMLHESPAKEFDWASAPYTKLLITREDGQMATLLYERGSGTFAWGRITTGEALRETITEREIATAKIWHERDTGIDSSRYGEKFTPPSKKKRFVKALPEGGERSGLGMIRSAAVLPGPDGFDDAYLIVSRKKGGEGPWEHWLERLREDGKVYLDSWREWKFETEEERDALHAQYNGETAIFYSPQKGTGPYNGRPLPAASRAGFRVYIGYPYSSVMRSMPIVNNKEMQPANVSRLFFRFDDSYPPEVTELPSERKNGFGEWKGPFSGVKQIDCLGGQSADYQFELATAIPRNCRVLAAYAEA